MKVELIEFPVAVNAQDETPPATTFMAEGLPHVAGIDDFLGKEVTISELQQRIQELVNTGGDAMERIEVPHVIPYLLDTAFMKDASEHLTLISPAIVLMIVLDALVDRFGDSECKVMLR